jgi:WD40 repeat protein
MSPRVREETVRRRNFIILAYLLAVSFMLMARPASSKQEAGWTTYKLPVHDVPWGISIHGLEGKPWASANVRACAFTPDSKTVALFYLSDHLLSEKPWKDVYTSHLAVWDFRTGKVEEKLKWDYTSNNQGDPWSDQARYVRYTEDGRHLVALGATTIRVLDARNFAELKKIAYEPPKEKFPDDGWATVGFSLAPDGSRAAVAISSTIGANGGFVRVYDLRSGQIVREWRLHDGVRYVTGVALSSDGERVAISSLPIGQSSDPEAFIPLTTDNVRVMDVKSGETLAGVNTKYVAGPVLFGPNDTLLTGSINDDRKGYKYDSVKIWDARSGKLLREITNPRTGVHYRLDLSPDGKLLLGYTGTEKPVENFVNIDSQQFQIWDFGSGTVVASSPKILPVKNVDLPPEIQLSPDGKFVLVSWGNASIPPNAPVVYEIPQP